MQKQISKKRAPVPPSKKASVEPGDRNSQFNDKYPDKLIIGVQSYADDEDNEGLVESNTIHEFSTPIHVHEWTLLQVPAKSGRVVAIYRLERLVEISQLKKLVMTDADGNELRTEEQPL